MATQRGCPLRRSRSSVVISSSSWAWCGWVPTEHHTVVFSTAMSRISVKRFTRVEMVTMPSTPLALARAKTPARSAASSGKSRWQWLSMSNSACLRGLELFEHRLGRRQLRAGRNEQVRIERVLQLPLVCRHAEQVEQLAGRLRHEGLGSDGAAADDIGRRREDGAHAREIVLLSPRRLVGEVEVAGAQRADQLGGRLVQLLGHHRFFHTRDGGDGFGYDLVVLAGALLAR